MSKKKKKKTPTKRKKKPPTPARFAVAARVRVKPGTTVRQLAMYLTGAVDEIREKLVRHRLAPRKFLWAGRP